MGGSAPLTQPAERGWWMSRNERSYLNKVLEFEGATCLDADVSRFVKIFVKKMHPKAKKNERTNISCCLFSAFEPHEKIL